MKSFSRGSFLVAILDLFQSVLGIIVGCKWWVLFRKLNPQGTFPQEINIQFQQLRQVGNEAMLGSPYNNVPTEEVNEDSIIRTNQFYFAVALYFVVLLCVLSFAIVLIFGIRWGSSLKIKLWLYPNIGVLVLSGVGTLLYSLFNSNDICKTVTMGVISMQIAGGLIFRALQCWIVNEALSEIPKDEMFALERVKHTMASSDKRARFPPEIAVHLGNDSVI